MADIDRKILAYTRDYVRWVDDFRIFFDTCEQARAFLHSFTEYIHDVHRLVLSGEKTRIVSVSGYKKLYRQNDAARESKELFNTKEILVLKEHRDEIFRQGGYYDTEEEFDEEIQRVDGEI
jgi:hypothetical protein